MPREITSPMNLVLPQNNSSTCVMSPPSLQVVYQPGNVNIRQSVILHSRHVDVVPGAVSCQGKVFTMKCRDGRIFRLYFSKGCQLSKTRLARTPF